MNVRNDETNFTPAGWHSVTPRIVAHHAEQLVEFLKHVFNATGEYRTDRPAILTIGDSMVMISDAGIRDPTPAFLYVYVADADITYQRALDAGARSLEEPSDTPYGDRRGMVQDHGTIYGRLLLISVTNPLRLADCRNDHFFVALAMRNHDTVSG
jgi:PhnB protein